jgi:hypothetical protein
VQQFHSVRVEFEVVVTESGPREVSFMAQAQANPCTVDRLFARGCGLM